ncbi:MAG: ankyrin repeat domain-containing protein [Bacteroidetes bacterium]|jgi:ankyrin repeat protein|nr:ankyrin repeat domain-containing protein [Bacteroidota bacterium]
MKNKLLFTLTLLFLWVGCSSDDTSQRPQGTFSQPDTQTSQSYSAEDLRNASLQGDLESVRQIVDSGVNIEEGDQLDRTPLMFASFNGHSEVVLFLIEQGADVQKQNSEGRTPLMFASSGPFPETVELLLENGADPNIKDSVEGWSALMYAAAEGNMEVIEVLLDYNADISLSDTDGETAADFARNNGHSDAVALLEN